MLYNVKYIRDDIIRHVNKKKPFSLVRIGDGDLKLIISLINNKVNKAKFKRSGIPKENGSHILSIYKNSCNNANYISSFEMYYTNKFWHRNFSVGTKKKILKWKEIYKRVGIINQRYCNPEVGYLLFLSDIDLLSPLKEKRICLITCFKDLGEVLKSNGYNISLIEIPGPNKNHYLKYNEVSNKIKVETENNDIFLVGGGVLGRGYCDIIKNNGGVAVDIGQVMNSWNNKKIAERFKNVLTLKGLFFSLTPEAQKYKNYI